MADAATQKTVELKAGMHIRIPKGSTIYETKSYWPNKSEDTAKVTTRDTVAMCSEVREMTEWVKIPGKFNTIHAGTPHERKVQMQQQVSHGWIAMWANDKKYTFVENVQVCDAPVRKEAVRNENSGPTLRQRMVKGTKWKLTKDAKLEKDGQKYKELLDDGVIPAGTEIEIVDKFQTYGPGWADGLWVPVAYGEYSRRLVRFTEINQEPEQVGESEVVPVFAIFDTAKQQYYTGYEWKGWNTPENERSVVEYSEKLTKAKKFNRLSDVRVHALVMSGYYYDLPESWGSVPDWMTGSKNFDIPETWEIVKYDKLTKKVLDRIELIDTFKRSWKLRALTVKYGSAVRAVYSYLEKNNKLGEFSAMLMFNRRQDDKRWYYDELSPEEKAEAQSIVDQFDKKDVKVQKSSYGFAVATKDIMTATMVRLAYDGDMECALIDFEKMEEVVAEGKQTK